MVPHIEHSPFDLVIYKDGCFKRVQVKYRELTSKGGLEVSFRSTYCNSKGIVTSVVDKNEIDVYCVYCPQTYGCYYMDPKQFDKSLSLRVAAPKNNQLYNI